MTNYKYAVIRCEGAMKDFHEKAKDWDDNYLRWVKEMVDFEIACRKGEKTFIRDIEDYHNKSVVVGSNNAHWRNQQ